MDERNGKIRRPFPWPFPFSLSFPWPFSWEYFKNFKFRWMFEEAYEVLENDFIDTDETVISAVFHLKKCYFLETNDACYFNLEDGLFRRDSRPQSKTCAFTGCALSESIFQKSWNPASVGWSYITTYFAVHLMSSNWLDCIRFLLVILAPCSTLHVNETQWISNKLWFQKMKLEPLNQQSHPVCGYWVK